MEMRRRSHMRDQILYTKMLRWLLTMYDRRRSVFLANRFAKAIQKHARGQIIDNFRVKLVGNDIQEKVYTMQRDAGCCASYDESFTFLSNDSPSEVYSIGFNYGH